MKLDRMIGILSVLLRQAILSGRKVSFFATQEDTGAILEEYQGLKDDIPDLQQKLNGHSATVIRFAHNGVILSRKQFKTQIIQSCHPKENPSS